MRINNYYFYHRELCKKLGFTSGFIWSGIKRYGREWVKADGSVLDSNIRIDWRPGYPASYNGWDYLTIHCNENNDNYFGRFENWPESSTFKFICQ